MTAVAVKYIHSDDDGRNKFYGAAIHKDVKTRNEKNFDHWTAAQVAEAQELQRTVTAAYSPRDVYINYRQRFIAVSAYMPAPCMTQQGAIARLTRHCELNNIQMVASAQHIIFRMFKKK